jgi:hypothetical protein
MKSVWAERQGVVQINPPASSHVDQSRCFCWRGDDAVVLKRELMHECIIQALETSFDEPEDGESSILSGLQPQMWKWPTAVVRYFWLSLNQRRDVLLTS